MWGWANQPPKTPQHHPPTHRDQGSGNQGSGWKPLWYPQISIKTKETKETNPSLLYSHHFNQAFWADLNPELVSASTIDAHLLSRGRVESHVATRAFIAAINAHMMPRF